MSSGGGKKANDLFTALGHPVRRRVLREMIGDGGEISPRQLADRLDEPLPSLSYHVRVLAECGAIKLVQTTKVRGSTQHFYRSTLKAEWARSALEATKGQAKKKRSRGEERG